MFAALLISVSLSSSSSALQGSTESNATNDEEEMKGRKGTQLSSLLFPVLIRSLSVSHLVKRVSLTVVAGRCVEMLHVSLTLLTVCLWCVDVCICCVSGCLLCVCSSGQFGAESEQRHRGDAPTSALTSKFTCQ